jgi:hypothetical protein
MTRVAESMHSSPGSGSSPGPRGISLRRSVRSPPRGSARYECLRPAGAADSPTRDPRSAGHTGGYGGHAGSPGSPYTLPHLELLEDASVLNRNEEGSRYAVGSITVSGEEGDSAELPDPSRISRHTLLRRPEADVLPAVDEDRLVTFEPADPRCCRGRRREGGAQRSPEPLLGHVDRITDSWSDHHLHVSWKSAG